MKAIEEAFHRLGHATIIIAGNSGVGKSTLINAVFRENIAETGIGEPVTTETHEYTHENLPITIIDTQGFETGESGEKIYRDLKGYIEKKNRSTDPNNHVHLAWLCISEMSARVQEAEKNFLALMNEMNVPTVVVITKAVQQDTEFRNEVRTILPTAKNWVWVISKPITIPIAGQEHAIGPIGLETLLEISYQLIPEGQRGALVAANRIDVKQKLSRSHAIVAGAAAAAGGIGAIPVPFSDAVALIPTQITMLAYISLLWGLSIDKAFIGTLVGSSVSRSVGLFGGRLAVSNLIKLIPGAGAIIGGAISGTTAALLTTAFGEAYIATLYQLLKDDPDRELSPIEIKNLFKDNLADHSLRLREQDA